MCDGLERAVDGTMGDVCLTNHNIDVGAEYGRWTSFQAVFGETRSPRLLGHLLDVHDQFCTACTDKLRMAKAVNTTPVIKEGSNTRAVGVTDVRPVSPLGILASVSPGGECSNTHSPGNTYSRRQAMQKTVAYSCRTGSNTYKTETTANVTSNASNNIYYPKYIEDSHLVPRGAYRDTGMCPEMESYKKAGTNSHGAIISIATDNVNDGTKWTFENRNGYVGQAFSNVETDTSDTVVYLSDLKGIATHPVESDDRSHTDSCSTVSENAINMSVDIGKKDRCNTMDCGSSNAHKELVDSTQAIYTPDNCTGTLTYLEVPRISEIGQYDKGNAIGVTSQTVDATKACSSRSMLGQDSDVYTQKDVEKPDTKQTTAVGETDQCQAIDGYTGHEVTTLEDYGVTGHHDLEMECETPEMDHDSEDEAQCCSEPSMSECLLLDHPYGVGSLSTSDRKGKALQCHHCGIVCMNSRRHIAHIVTHFTQNSFHCDKCCESRANKTNPGIHKARDSARCPLCKLCGKLLANGPPKLTCKRCGKTYTSSSRYPRHPCRNKSKYKVTKHKCKQASMKDTITEHTCQECNKTFSKQASLVAHLRIHSTDKICKCDVCGKVYSSRRGLQHHTLICHTDRESHACVICPKTFRCRPYLTRHMLIHEGKKNFTCDECGKKFYTQTALTRHSVSHTGEKAHQCDTCGATFSRLDGLKNHVLVIHDGVKNFTCELCQKSFSTNASLISHTRNHMGDKPFVCATCGKGFSQKSSMGIHMRTHSGERPFTCTTCGKRFSHKQTMNTHMRTHSGKRSFPCTTCGKRFAHKQSLIHHTRTHTGDLPFSCAQCGKSFSRKQNMNTHMRTHTGERPFPCTICGKKLNTKQSLDYHTRLHSGERLFPCTTCGKIFVLKQDLVTHSRTHTEDRSSACNIGVHSESHRRQKPFTCSHCSKMFATKQHLVAHKRQHVGPYSCTICPRSFDTEAALDTHGRRHTCSRHRPFVCSLCGHTFRTKAALTIHYGRIHR